MQSCLMGAPQLAEWMKQHPAERLAAWRCVIGKHDGGGAVLALGPLFNLCAFADAAAVHRFKPLAVQLRGQCIAVLVRMFS
jgi:hypothetical protein